jgi:predicted GTPase
MTPTEALALSAEVRRLEQELRHWRQVAEQWRDSCLAAVAERDRARAGARKWQVLALESCRESLQ